MKYIKIKKVSELHLGSIVKHKDSNASYLITECYGDRATGVRTIDITNTDEWEVLNLKQV